MDGGRSEGSTDGAGDALHPIDIDDDDDDDDDIDRPNNGGGTVSGIDPRLYDNSADLDDYGGLIERFGMGSERRNLGASDEEVDRIGSVLQLDHHQCNICKHPVEMNNHLGLAGGYLFHSQCVADSQCPICLDTIGDATTAKILSCGHHGHRECIDQAMRRSVQCPLCRKNQRD